RARMRPQLRRDPRLRLRLPPPLPPPPHPPPSPAVTTGGPPHPPLGHTLAPCPTIHTRAAKPLLQLPDLWQTDEVEELVEARQLLDDRDRRAHALDLRQHLAYGACRRKKRAKREDGEAKAPRLQVV